MTLARLGWRRLAGGAALAVLLAVLLVDFGRLLAIAAAAIGYPYDLDYGEGIVWQQMTAIATGHGYAPLGTFPAIVFHYPPVYHLVVAAAVTVTGGDPLAVGRSVSLVSTLVSIGLVGWLAALASPTKDRTARAIGGIAGGLTFVASQTLFTWAPLMRVDMLATALTLGGLVATARTLRTPERWPVAEAVLFALAVFTKQTAIVGPIAAFAALWWVRPRAAWRFALLCGGVALAMLAALLLQSRGQFLRHIIGYNVNRFDLSRWKLLVAALAPQATTLALAIVGLVEAGRRLRERPVELLLALYLTLRVATLPLSLKSGASENYFIDLLSVAAIYAGVVGIRVAAGVLGRGRWPGALATMLLLAALPAQAAWVGSAHEATHNAAWRALNDEMVARIRAEPKPVLNDFMVLTLRAGKPVEFEPAIAAELGHLGLYDEAGLVRLIRARAFGFLLADEEFYTRRYNPAVRAAIAAAYPRIERHGAMTLHLQALASGAGASARVQAAPRSR